MRVGIMLLLASGCAATTQPVARPVAERPAGLSALAALGAGEKPSAEAQEAYCELTRPVVRGEELERTRLEQTFALGPDSVTCQVEHSYDYLHRPQTHATMVLRLGQPIARMLLPTPPLVRQVWLEGHVGESEACKLGLEVARSAAQNGGRLPASVERTLLRQDWLNEQPPSVHWLEEVRVSFGGELVFEGGAQLAVPRDRCGG